MSKVLVLGGRGRLRGDFLEYLSASNLSVSGLVRSVGSGRLVATNFIQSDIYAPEFNYEIHNEYKTVIYAISPSSNVGNSLGLINHDRVRKL